MQTVTVTCDACGADLSGPVQCPRYRLALQAESLPFGSGTIAAVHVTPPLRKPHHFCGFACLLAWAARELPIAYQAAAAPSSSGTSVPR